MRVSSLEVIPVNVRYTSPEVSALTRRVGITQTLVRLTTDEGLTGWGESPRTADAEHIREAVRAMRPLVVGRDPFDTEPIARDIDRLGMWAFQSKTRNIAFSGIDMALWDILGKASGQPLYRLFGGAYRQEVDYFYYLNARGPGELKRQAAEGLDRGYGVFYLKAGVDEAAEEESLEVLRSTVGWEKKIRIDANAAWDLPTAVRLLRSWHDRYRLDFVEAPVPPEPLELMRELRAKVEVPLCANEGLWRQEDVIRIVNARAADYLCFSPYWVGSLRRFSTLSHYAGSQGLAVCKHTPGELGLMAAASHHMMLSLPNATDGNQQTAQLMEGDVLTERLPIASAPRWGLIQGPGLGVEVDEDKVREYHEAYLTEGAHAPYGSL